MIFPFSFWKTQGIDPLSLGQPVIYFAPFDNNYLTNIGGNPPVDGDNIVTFKRYTDNGLTFTRTNATSNAIYKTGIANLPMARWENNLSTNGGYTGGNTSTLNFMHADSICEFTLYFVFRNIMNENTGTTKVIMSTGNSTGNRGFIFFIGGSGVSGTPRSFTLQIRNNTAGQNAMAISANNAYTTDQDFFKVISIRCKKPAGIGQLMATMYINGIAVATANLDNALAAQLTSTTAPFFGNRSSGDLRLNGNVGDLFIFPTEHDLNTHGAIVSFLRSRWGI